MELQRVDAALKQTGWHEGEAAATSPVALLQLAQVLDADVFLRGTVTNWGRTYLLVQSWVKAELELELVDAQGGEVIWSEKRKNTRTAGILKLPTGYKAIVTQPIMGLKTGYLERAADHLTRRMAEDLTSSPAVLAYLGEQQP